MFMLYDLFNGTATVATVANRIATALIAAVGGNYATVVNKLKSGLTNLIAAWNGNFSLINIAEAVADLTVAVLSVLPATASYMIVFNVIKEFAFLL